MTEEEKAAKEAADKLAADEAAKDKKDKKVSFDPDQTAFINKLYNDAFAEGAKKVEDNFKKQIEEEKKQRELLAAQLAEIQKAATAPDKKEKKDDPPKVDPQIEQFKAQMAEMQDVLKGIKTERDQLKDRVDSAERERRKSQKRDKFLEALQKAQVSFFDPLEAYDLAEKNGYEWDPESDRPVVINKDTNRPRLNGNGEPMSVEDFVKDFAEKKKYLVKAPNQDGGTGSSENRRSERPQTGQQKSFSDMTDEEFAAYTAKIVSSR